MENTLDWKKAEEKLLRKLEEYKELIGMPDVNPWFALGMISGLKDRFDKGERTQALYDDIMELS